MKKTVFITIIALASCMAGRLDAQNPVIRDQFSADPTAKVFDGKVYLYPSHDIRDERNPRGLDWFCMADYHVFSSDNLTDWHDHGVILSQEDVPWGNPAGFAMWAPDCVCKDGKYYFFFPNGPKDGMGFRIGVAVADSPTGPFRPEEQYIEGVMGIDPCVLQASDGNAYLYWQGMGLQAARMTPDLLGIAGEPVNVQEGLPDGFKEGPFAFEREGRFYLTYPWVREENGTETLAYAIGDDPLGPFEYKGLIMEESPVGCWTNHHSIVEIDGQWYLFYHHNDYSPSFDKNRSVRIDKLYFNEDGTIRQVTPTLRGVGLVKAAGAIQPDRYSEAENVSLEFLNADSPFDGWFIRYAREKKGAASYSTFCDVDFGDKAPSGMSARLRSDKGGTIRFIAGGRTVGRIRVPKNSEWKEYRIHVRKKLTGVKDMKFKLVRGCVDLDMVSFSDK